MKTTTITTALITATLVSGPVMANNNSAKFDVDAVTSNYEFQHTLSKLKDSTRIENSFSHKTTIIEKQRLSEVMLKDALTAKDHTTAQITKPRIHLITKPNLHQIR